MRKLLLAAGALGLIGTAALVASCYTAEVGYYSPQFTPDGTAVVVIVRDARAFVAGFGFETFTPPARSIITHDRFSVVRFRLTDGHGEVVTRLPASPLEGETIQTYRPRVHGSASAHLRWATPEALEYEVAVTIPRQPSSDMHVIRHRWDPSTSQWKDSAGWERGSSGMGGTERSQLSGPREVVAVGAGAMSCAVVIVTEGQAMADVLVETPSCRKTHPDGYPVSALQDLLRRGDLERVAHLEETHARLLAEARARGLQEGDAALEAIRGMQRLGLYPKPPTVTATRVAAADSSAPVFAISDEEFRVGLFQDLRAAIDRPGEDVERSGSYVIHRDFDTSRRLNEYLADKRDATFFVEADGAVWRMEVHRP
jgi:hypothetical protein